LGFPEANVIPGKIQSSNFTSEIFEAVVDVTRGSTAAIAGIRPEGILIGKHPGTIAVSATLTLLENLGSEFAAYLDVKGTQFITVLSRTDIEGLKLIESKNLTISIKPEAITLFDFDSKKKIGTGVAHV